MAELLFTAALLALGFYLRGWRRVTRERSAPRFGARAAVVLPLLAGIGLAVLLDVVAAHVGLSPALHGILLVQAMLIPSALLVRGDMLGASSAGVGSAHDRWPMALGMWVRSWPLLQGLGFLVALTASAFGVESLGVASELAAATTDLEFAVFALAGVLVVPALEELFFRGRLFARLAVHLGPGPANFLQALLFGLAHGWFHFPILMYFGWLLGRARLAGAGMGSLVLVHAAHNALSFALLAAAR